MMPFAVYAILKFEGRSSIRVDHSRLRTLGVGGGGRARCRSVGCRSARIPRIFASFDRSVFPLHLPRIALDTGKDPKIQGRHLVVCMGYSRYIV